jgi:hypothetical protein
MAVTFRACILLLPNIIQFYSVHAVDLYPKAHTHGPLHLLHIVAERYRYLDETV